MRRFQASVRQRPLVRIAIATAGFAVLGLGWRITSAGPAADGALAAETIPADYVPLGDDVPLAAVTIALTAAPAPIVEPALSAPLQRLRITSSFGMRRHPILGFSRMHQGVDFAAPEGAPVLAAADGVVTEADRDGGYGNMLRIRHGGGWATGYAHLMAFASGLAPGAKVLKGEVVGFVGRTGLATGPHLHYEVELDGVKLDPMKTPFGFAPTPDEAAAAAATFAQAAPLPAAPSPLHLRPALATD
jgi:murein DD-endopeptidase MepM/ murein hydrolase activator NlpD